MRLAIVTATLDLARAGACIRSWIDQASAPIPLYVVDQAANEDTGWWEVVGSTWALKRKAILGVVPAFALGVQKALEDGAEIVACLHDDLEIQEVGWDDTVKDLFAYTPQAGLCGFGGGLGLGASDIYQTPYNPMQLARQDFISNMRDAEAHGRRVVEPTRVSCLDGFAQIGRREFWRGLLQGGMRFPVEVQTNLFTVMKEWGIIHHFYDGCLGAFAKRLDWETWMLPVGCHHFGGVTAAGDPRYQAWAADQRKGATINGHPASGDQIFWREAHRIGYQQFKDVLPLRVP